MDFNEAKEEAESWTENVGVPFKLVGAIEEERRLIFEAVKSVSSHDASHRAPISKSFDDGAVSTSLFDTTIVVRPCTFYVVCPCISADGDAEAGADSEVSWHVWSDEAEVLPKLSAVQDFIHTCREKKLSEILDKVFISLKKYLSTPLGEDVNKREDDDDMGFDDVDDDLAGLSDDDAAAGNDDDNVDAGEGMQMLPNQPGSVDTAGSFFVGHASQIAVHRILKDLKQLQEDACRNFGIEGKPRGDNLFIWDVRLSNFPSDSLLGKDLERYAKKYNRDPVVSLEMRFPDEYPMAPPFVRVTRPKFQSQTGHITIGGSICMEMLTRSGWRPTNDIEGILVQIRAEIMSDPKTCLDPHLPDREYNEMEARQAFQRMVQRYGWK